MQRNIGKGTLSLRQGDITRQDTEAIVNAANSGLMGGGGVDGAIHRAGGPAILEECEKIVAKIGRLGPGGAVITAGGRLAARYVIHAVGPIWRGGEQGERETLASAYRESLKRAVEKALKSVSFPSLSTGAYRFPVDEAARVALGAVRDFMKENPGLALVQFVLFDEATLQAYRQALEELEP
jgi:O-acetyl-ADP-ribose deacetylase (regulator of RNase III)